MTGQPTVTGKARAARVAALRDAVATRVLVLEGAMGTMIQSYRLTEADFRGERFREHRTP